MAACTGPLNKRFLQIFLLGSSLFLLTFLGRLSTYKIISSAVAELQVTIDLSNCLISTSSLIANLTSSFLFASCWIVLITLYWREYFFSLPILFYCGFIVFHGIGANILFSLNSMLDWLIVNISIFGFTISVMLFNFAFRSKKYIYISSKFGLIRASFHISLFLFIIFTSSMFFYYFLIGGAPFFIALKQIFKGNIDVAKQIIYLGRQSQYYDTTNYIGQGYFELIRLGLLPYLSLLIFLKYYKNKFKLFGYISIGTVILLSLASGQRWPTAFFILTLVYFFILIYNLKIWSNKIISVGLVLLFFMLSLTFLMNRSSVQEVEGGMLFFAIINRLFYRITLASHIPVFFTYELFPEKIPFQFGKIWLQDIIALLPGPDQTFGVIYSTIIGQSWGSAPLTLLGELYANFGLLGPIIGFMLLGLILAYLQELFRKIISRESSYVVDYVILGIGLIRLCYGSSIGFISNTLLPIIFFRLLFLFIRLPFSK